MAEVTQEKGRGLRFAEEQLRRHGWEHGKGLGRAEDGIAEAIKVKVKCNKGGVGHKESEQFTFHWWDHVFNKASSRLQVESDQDGVALKKTVEEGEEANASISNKKPRVAAARAKLYGCFVKSATLLSGQEKPEPKSADAAEDDDGSSSSSSSSDEEDDEKLDLSSTTKLSDGELMKACGGRTAHKGARHGLTMSAKLARLEQQEAEFMAKYGKKNQPQPGPAAETPPTAQSADLQEETSHDPPSKKKKKKKKVTDEDVNAACENTDTAVKPKKKKNKDVTEEVAAATEVPEDTEKVKKKHKKKKNAVEQSGEDTERTVEKKKKKKKSSKHQSEDAEEEQCANTESSQSEPAEGTEEEEPQSRKKRKKDQTCVRDEEEVPPKKKKKKKKSKELHL